LIIQDLSKENRFNQHDQQIMLAVANQIAANIRYIRMIESVRQKAENELLIAEMSRKISASTSVESVLRTAVKELGQYFRASNTQIILDISSESSPKKINGAG
jgi:GAF domain-containing protein